MAERKVVVGVFQERAQARKAVADLESAGFTEKQVGFAIRNPDGAGEPKLNVPEVKGEKPTESTPLKTTIGGGVVGGILGALTALLIPGIGPVLAGGILAGALGGALVGAGVSDMVGTLMDMGVTQNQAQYYQQEFKEGRALVVVNTTDRQQEAEDILNRDGAMQQKTRTPID